MTGETDEPAEGLAAVEIPPHGFDRVSTREMGEYTVLKVNDNLESIGISLILTDEMKRRLVTELQE